MHAPFSVTFVPQNTEHLAVLIEAMNKSMAPNTLGETKTRKHKADVVTEVKHTVVLDKEPAIKPDEKTETALAIDLVTVRSRLAELSKAGKADQVKALITEMGAAKLTDIPATRYDELMQKAGAL